MAYASRSGRARTSAKKPEAFGVCDRCGIWHQLNSLSWQFQWAGTHLQNLWLRVCGRCLDIPQAQLRAITLPADPTPVWQPRVEAFEEDETNYRTVIPGCPGTNDPITGLPRPSTIKRATQDGFLRITQPLGVPNGLEQNAVMPYNGAVQRAYGVQLNPLSLSANGTATITATFAAPHGLCTNDQIAVDGITDRRAAGFYSVEVTTATAFTYQTTAFEISAGSLLTPTTRIVTALVGLPYGSRRIPQVGP